VAAQEIPQAGPVLPAPCETGPAEVAAWIHARPAARILLTAVPASAGGVASACELSGFAIVRSMYDDDYRVTSVPYRLMPPRKRAGPGPLGEALDAAGAGRSIREALDVASGTAAEADENAEDFSWAGSGSARQRQWPRRLGRVLARVEVWILIVGIVTAVLTYLLLVKPN